MISAFEGRIIHSGFTEGRLIDEQGNYILFKSFINMHMHSECSDVNRYYETEEEAENALNTHLKEYLLKTPGDIYLREAPIVFNEDKKGYFSYARLLVSKKVLKQAPPMETLQ